jgi:hypothetical protein
MSRRSATRVSVACLAVSGPLPHRCDDQDLGWLSPIAAKLDAHGVSAKNVLISVAVGVAAVVIAACVVRGVYTVGEGFMVACFTAVAGAVLAFGDIGGGDGWFGGGDGCGGGCGE